MKIDKSNWPEGPRMNEPDLIMTTHRSGVQLIIKRTPFGHLCGYVGLPPNHSLHGCTDDNLDVDVHGGISDAEKGNNPYDDSEYWYVGFDCAHFGDYSPGISKYCPDSNYRDLRYVSEQLQSLAQQLNDHPPVSLETNVPLIEE